MEQSPKYSIQEIERRWLVNPSDIGNLENSPYQVIEDLYISGTRLRLRSVETQKGKFVYKLGKKYGKNSKISEPITTIYLTLQEYETFSNLPGKASKKHRYPLNEGSLDRYVQPEIGNLIFEVEFSDEAKANNYAPPSFVSEEITGLDKYNGFTLSQES